MRRLVQIAIGLAAGGLALAYAVRLQWAGALIVVALGGLWLLGERRGWGWTGGVGLSGCVAAAVAGIWSDLPALWMLVSVVSTMVAWDLHRFERRRSMAGDVEAMDEVARIHLQRVLLVAGLGILLGGITLGTGLQLNFAWALVLGAVLILALSRVLRFIHRTSD